MEAAADPPASVRGTKSGAGGGARRGSGCARYRLPDGPMGARVAGFFRPNGPLEPFFCLLVVVSFLLLRGAQLLFIRAKAAGCDMRSRRRGVDSFVPFIVR